MPTEIKDVWPQIIEQLRAENAQLEEIARLIVQNAAVGKTSAVADKADLARRSQK